MLDQELNHPPRIELSVIMPMEESPLFCDRCLTELRPGEGNFYVVKIEAVADPTPSLGAGKWSTTELRQEIETLIAQMQDQSERELVDQVYRRVTIFLCNRCYSEWIENPAGG